MSKVTIKNQKQQSEKIWEVGDVILTKTGVLFKVYYMPFTGQRAGGGIYVFVQLNAVDIINFAYFSLEELYDDCYEDGDQVVDIDIIIK